VCFRGGVRCPAPALTQSPNKEATMSENNSTPLDDAVAYWRMSSSPQEKSIPEQRAEMLPRAKKLSENRSQGTELAAVRRKEVSLRRTQP
jgi:hypothetical protein